MYSKQESEENDYFGMLDKSPFGDLEFVERQEPEKSIVDSIEARGLRMEQVDFQIGQTQKVLEELKMQLEQMAVEKSKWFELLKVEVEISNKEQELEYFESVKLGLLRSQTHEKENELEAIKDRSERLDHYHEQVNEMDRGNEMDDRSPFIG